MRYKCKFCGRLTVVSSVPNEPIVLCTECHKPVGVFGPNDEPTPVPNSDVEIPPEKSNGDLATKYALAVIACFFELCFFSLILGIIGHGKLGAIGGAIFGLILFSCITGTWKGIVKK